MAGGGGVIKWGGGGGCGGGGQADPPLLALCLRPEPAVIGYLTGQPGLDPRLAPFCEMVDPALTWSNTVLHPQAAEGLIRFVDKSRLEDIPFRLFFEGARGAGQTHAAEALALERGAPLLIADMERAAECHADPETVLPAIFLEAQFRRAVILLENADSLPHRLLESLVDDRSGLTIISGPRSLPGWFAVPFPALSGHAARHAWQRAAEDEGVPLSAGTVESLSARLKLTPGQIAQTVRAARCHMLWRGAGSVDGHDLDVGGAIACRPGSGGACSKGKRAT